MRDTRAWWADPTEVAMFLRHAFCRGIIRCVEDEVLYYLAKPWKWTQERISAMECMNCRTTLGNYQRWCSDCLRDWAWTPQEPERDNWTAAGVTCGKMAHAAVRAGLVPAFLEGGEWPLYASGELTIEDLLPRVPQKYRADQEGLKRFFDQEASA